MSQHAKGHYVVCPVNITVGFISARATVIASAGFVPLSTDGTGLGGICFIDNLKSNSLILKLVLQIILNLPKVPVGELLGNLPRANFLASFGGRTVLFLPPRSVALDAFGVAAVDLPNFVFHAPVHEILGDFVSLVFYLMPGLGKDIAFLALKLLPSAGAFLAFCLGFGYAAKHLVAESVD